MVIGRSASANLQLEDPTLSRVHAVLQKDGERWFLVDKSSNGTWLDGAKLDLDKPVQLKPDAMATLGAYSLKFRLVTRAAVEGATHRGNAPVPAAAPVEAPPITSPSTWVMEKLSLSESYLRTPSTVRALPSYTR
jgi:pSer/pThr/pTyr-binding forkhead associated (FHA) protein